MISPKTMLRKVRQLYREHTANYRIGQCRFFGAHFQPSVHVLRH